MSADDDPMAELAREAAAYFGLRAPATITLCNVSENHTYRVEDPVSAARYALRIHRPGYRSVAEIRSELMWIDALGVDGTVETPRAIVAAGGDRVVSVSNPAIPELGSRDVVMFQWLDGVAPDLDDGEAAARQFEILGATSARMHEHAARWDPPDGFRRPRWDYRSTIGPGGHWGPWQDGLGIGPEERRQLERLDATIASRLRAFGEGAERFGLIHADMRLANLLVDRGDVRVIDFDDCGFSWYMYDFATTVSFMEDHPRVPELRDAWVRGYRTARPLEPAAEAELQTFVMLRRLLLVAWIGSHHTFATEAAELGAGFTAGTCALAEDYLSTH
jgi:Ser/Thr protein kinase RdoA (MazF antagonist)